MSSAAGKDGGPMTNGAVLAPEDEPQASAYLQMIQSVIDRMSTVSAIYKGFASSVLAGIVTISFKDADWYVLAILVLPMLGFMSLDVRHLCTEKAYRELFNEVRAGHHPVDFNLDINGSISGCTVCKSIRSWSIWLFYGPLFIAWAVLTTLRFCGVE